ncbi:MAG: tRNA preQ1(34) S-adenosylmethionine ribosyltransferase-isomerase QueA [Bdellovibrionota bacterium]
MKTSLFDYHLPEELIARRPAERRSDSRLLLLDRKAERFSHHRFHELPEILSPGDLVVGNRTRVFPARVQSARKGGGRSEILLLEPVGEPAGGAERWKALVRGAARLKEGDSLRVPHAEITVEGREGDKTILRIAPAGGKSVPEWAERVGEIPLPPYLRRQAELSDRERYQTVYAKEGISVAAPTAGLHFDDAVITALRAKEISFETLRLDVGWGTFAPIRGEDVESHVLDAEPYEISESLSAEIRKRRSGEEPGRIVAVGTTVTRTLETAFAEKTPHLRGRSGLYITPGYRFHTVSALLTNFHLPKTSLLVLVCAFAGRELILAAYEEAVRQKYRFYSYGDCMVVL